MVIRVSSTSEVGRSPEEVFAFVANGENDPRWNAWTLDAKRVSGGEIGPGTRFQGRMKRFGEIAWHIGDFQPPRRLTLISEGRPAGTHTIELEPTRGGTRVIQVGEVRPSAAMLPMLPVMFLMFRSHFKQLARGLVTALGPPSK
jgi:uncharacterized protein YndB with AHSA1/START domain